MPHAPALVPRTKYPRLLIAHAPAVLGPALSRCSVQAGAQRHLRVVPLFETKADLEEAGKTIKALLDIDWYHKVGSQ